MNGIVSRECVLKHVSPVTGLVIFTFHLSVGLLSECFNTIEILYITVSGGMDFLLLLAR